MNTLINDNQVGIDHKVVETIVPLYGLSFVDAINSTVDIWNQRLRDEGYNGDLLQAAKCMVGTIKGMKFLYNKLIDVGEIHDHKAMPRVDFDSQPGFSIFYFRPVNTIIASWEYLKQFEGYNLDTRFERTDKYTSIVLFKGSIAEFLFLKGVEELTHALLDPDIQEALSPIDPTVSNLDYYSQNHEYRALEWQIMLAKENNFSLDVISSLENLYNQISIYRENQKISHE